MSDLDTSKGGQGPAQSGDDRAAELLGLVDQARDLQQSGRTEEALALAERAETIARGCEFPRRLEPAQTLNRLGMIFFETGYTRTALPLYAQALAIAERLAPHDDDLLASLHNNLGQAEARLGRLEQAQTHLESSVAIRTQATPGSLALGFALDNLGSVHGSRGHLEQAEALHRQALAIFEQARGPIDTHVATALGNLSNVYRQRRDFQRAEACRLRALDTHERLLGLASPETLLDVAALADVHREQGDEARADTLMNLLLSIGGASPARAHRSLAEMLRALATTAFGDFRLDLAERLGARAVELLEAIEGPQAPDTLQALHLLANVQRATGHTEAADRAYHRALSGYEALQLHDEAVTVLIDLGKVYRDEGSYPLAEEVLRRALEHLRRAPGRDHQGIASALGNLALVHYEAEQYPRADAAFAEALAEVQQDTGRRFGERPWLLHNRAMLQYHLGQHDAAWDLYEEAKRLWTEEEGEDHPFVATAAANLALVHWARGDVERALTSFAEAERLRDREMQRIIAVGSETKRAAYARELQGDLHKVLTFCLALDPCPPEAAGFAAQMLVRRKGRVLDAIAHTLLQVREHPRPEDQEIVSRLQTVRREIAALMAPMLVTRRPTEARARLAVLRSEEERLEAALSYRSALSRPGLESVSLVDVQRALPRHGALIELLRFPVFDPARTGRKGPWKEPRYAAMVLPASGEPRCFDLGPASVVDAHLDKWRSLLRNRSSDEEAREREAGELWSLLIAPVRSALSGVRRLLVSPDGKLALIPFGLLRDPDGHPLSARFTVSYLTSGREVTRAGAAEPAASGVVVIAAPDFDAETGDGSSAAPSRLAGRARFAPLPGTKEEGEEIGALLDDVRLFTGRDATAEALRGVQRPLVLHVGTHGIFSPLEDEEIDWRMDLLSVGGEPLLIRRASTTHTANPMFYSGLALAGANRQAGGNGTGILTAQEVAGLDLRGTELVVLSACETGLGTVKQGEEFTGLRRALAIAGAATQVTSLWKVDDAATRVLMGHYYRSLLDGHGRAEALQLAQARTEQDPAHPEWRHPVYWAAFVSAGAWAPMPEGLRRRAGGGEDH